MMYHQILSNDNTDKQNPAKVLATIYNAEGLSFIGDAFEWSIWDSTGRKIGTLSMDVFLRNEAGQVYSASGPLLQPSQRALR